MSPDPPSGPARDEPPPGSGSGRRPYSRNDLFGPGGPFRSSSLADDSATAPTGEQARVLDRRPINGVPPGGDAATQAYRAPSDQATRMQAPPGVPTQAFQPTQFQPTQFQPQPQPYQPQQYQPQPYQPQPYQPQPYEPTQYQPTQYQQQRHQPSVGYPDGQGYSPGGGGYPPDLFPPNSYPPPDEPQGTRSRLVIALVALAVVGVLAAVFGLGLLPGQGDPSAGPSAAATSAAAATGEPGSSDEPSPSAAAKKKKEPSRAAAPIPDEPWDAKGLDFGFLTAVEQDGDTITLSVNRATYYYGDEATERNDGVPPDNDYLIEDANPKIRAFDLAEKASIDGNVRLGGDQSSTNRSLTPEEFLENAQEALEDGGEGIPVWLRHTDGLSGDVTALQEQYQP